MRTSSSFHKAPWPLPRCLYGSMFFQIMAEVEAAAQGHNQLKMLGDSSSIRYEDALQRCWSLLRSLHEIIINALRLFRRSRASRSLTKTGLYFRLLGLLGRSEGRCFYEAPRPLARCLYSKTFVQRLPPMGSHRVPKRLPKRALFYAFV